MTSLEITTIQMLKKEFKKLTTLGMSCPKYRKFHDKAESLGYECYEHFDSCRGRTVPMIQKIEVA
tara:strand:- start:84 stop:278 length:195 start_codon:yes stop_codon:yes gene_type:complete